MPPAPHFFGCTPVKLSPTQGLCLAEQAKEIHHVDSYR
jgi:hypothetical protein